MRMRSRSLACVGQFEHAVQGRRIRTVVVGKPVQNAAVLQDLKMIWVSKCALYGSGGHVVPPLRSRVDALRLVPRPQD